jgi:hypothetical protein
MCAVQDTSVPADAETPHVARHGLRRRGEESDHEDEPNDSKEDAKPHNQERRTFSTNCKGLLTTR